MKKSHTTPTSSTDDDDKNTTLTTTTTIRDDILLLIINYNVICRAAHITTKILTTYRFLLLFSTTSIHSKFELVLANSEDLGCGFRALVICPVLFLLKKSPKIKKKKEDNRREDANAIFF